MSTTTSASNSVAAQTGSTTYTDLSVLPTPTLPSSTSQNAPNPTLPPLTTHWTVPLSCTWTYDIRTSVQQDTSGAVAWLDLIPMQGASTLSCYPDGMFTNGQTGVFSPATCPNGWTTAYATVNSEHTEATRTTTAVCCSS